MSFKNQLPQRRLHVFRNLLGHEAVTFHELAVGDLVVEFLLEAFYEYVHVAVAVEAGNLFAEAAIDHAVFERHDNLVVGAQAFQHFAVDAGCKSRVDDGGVDSLLGEFCCGFFGDGHLVVVHHHDKVRRVFARVVEAFECFAAAQRTVTDDGDHVALFALDIAGGRKPFSEILSHYPLERILSNYHLMHEADITKMAEMIESTL